MRSRRHIGVVLCLGVASLISASRFALAESAPAAPPATEAAPAATEAKVPKGERGVAAEGTAREPGSPPPPTQTETGFDFGSYGRLNIGTDGRGHEGYATNVVSHGSRLEEPPYIELNFYYSRLIGGNPHKRWRVVLVPA